MKLWKKLLPLIVVVVVCFPFVSGWVAAEQPVSTGVYTIAPSSEEVWRDVYADPAPGGGGIG